MVVREAKMLHFCTHVGRLVEMPIIFILYSNGRVIGQHGDLKCQNMIQCHLKLPMPTQCTLMPN